MGIKRVVLGALAVGLLFAAMVWWARRPTVPVLRVYTWSNYFPQSLLDKFEERTGIHVELSFFSSNEELFAKLRAGAAGFDVIQPSDYMIRLMKRARMLLPLDHAALPHLGHLDEFYRHPPHDPELGYSVPFTWGTTGIAINTALVPAPKEPIGWKYLLEPKAGVRTSLLDDPREAFGAVLMARGKSLNTRDLASLKLAQQDISRVKENILLFSSEPKALILREELHVAHVYSPDAIQAKAENPAIEYYIPIEGGTLWTDNFAIPASSKMAREAHAFIDFFLEPENALAIVEESNLATPNKTARERLPKSIRENRDIYPPPEVLRRLEYLEELGDMHEVLNRMWTELKT